MPIAKGKNGVFDGKNGKAVLYLEILKAIYGCL